jgi:hypothetical protein
MSRNYFFVLIDHFHTKISSFLLLWFISFNCTHTRNYIATLHQEFTKDIQVNRVKSARSQNVKGLRKLQYLHLEEECEWYNRKNFQVWSYWTFWSLFHRLQWKTPFLKKEHPQGKFWYCSWYNDCENYG